MEEQRRKRAKAIAAKLPESSSSRIPDAEPRARGNTSGYGDAPLILPDTEQQTLHIEASAEVGAPASLRNPNISTLVLVSEEAIEGTSPMHVVVEACEGTNNHINTALESGTVTDILLQRNLHITGMNEDAEPPAEPDMELNVPLHIHPSAAAGAAMGDHVELPLEAEIGTGTVLQRDFNTVAEEDQAEALTDSVTTGEGFIEIAPQVAPSDDINERIGLCTDARTVRHIMNPPNSPSIVGEEGQTDRADGMNCPICMEPWTGEGIHRICCLACGHLFGRSCIRRWLNQRGKKNSKCPHCNRKAKIEDIRNLYVPSLTVIDDKNQQLLEELGVLKSKNEELVLQNDKLRKEYEHLQAGLTASHPLGMSRGKDFFFTKRSFNTLQECSRRESYAVGNETKRRDYAQAYSTDTHKMQKAITVDDKESPGQFQLQEEFSLPGARVFDMDPYSQMLLVAQKSTAVGGAFNLSKISLLSLSDALVMPLPQCTGAVRDIRVAPPGGKLPGRLALVASLGKMISLFSLESNNVVLTYKLQSPCWSCAWDPIEPNYVFAGLQNGTLTIFDLRQTSSPVRSLQSLCRQPVHTLHPINECNLPQGIRRNGILSACSSGVCFWDSSMLGLHDSRPNAVACSDNPGVCVALAYNHLANVAVATFRGKPPVHQSGSFNHTSEVALPESSITPSQPNPQLNLGHPLRASHYPMVKISDTTPRRHECQNHDSTLPGKDMLNMNCGWTYGNPMFGYASPVGMHRSAIVCSSCTESSSDFQSVFAFGDEDTRSLMLWDVKTLTVMDRLKAHCSPILDVRSMNIGEHAFLSCISVTNLQVYKR